MSKNKFSHKVLATVGKVALYTWLLSLTSIVVFAIFSGIYFAFTGVDMLGNFLQHPLTH